VLVNDAGQHALWPAPARSPAGWRPAHGPDDRSGCLDYVAAAWPDLRPRLVAARLAPYRPPLSERLEIDHLELYVGDLAAAQRWLVDGYGFAVSAHSGQSGPEPPPAVSVALTQHRIRLLLTQPLTDRHPAASYLDRHGDGVAGVALRVPDAAGAFDEAVRRGARPVATPDRAAGVVTAAVAAAGDLTHRLVQRTGGDWPALPGLLPEPAPGPAAPAPGHPGLSELDHLAICLEPGQLDPTVDFYRRVFDFEVVFTEQIVVGSQAMRSKVVQSRSGAVTLTLLEPDQSRDPGQLDDFLKHHGGAGVQHVAFATDHIVRAVGALGTRGVEFLSTPDAYYRMLPERIELARHSVAQLHGLGILADQDHHGQLLQIFTRSVHPRRTLFLEVIERAGARTFGSGNIAALYQAVEAQRRAVTG
jgi:4-hydroxymandelate synthase